MSLGGSIDSHQSTISEYYYQCSSTVNCTFLFPVFTGTGAADQLLRDGARQHRVGPGALQWPEGGENFRASVCGETDL